MIKEMVDFSRQLETSGIYDRISGNLKKIDRPIMVIPVNDDLTGILVDEIYFVFKRIEGNTFYLEENGKEKAIKIDAPAGSSIPAKSLDQEDEKWQEILRSLRLYSNKLSTDTVGNKSIGGNKGTNSYHLLIFEGKIEDGIFGENKNTFKDKISGTYKKDTIEKGFPEDLQENEKKSFLALLEQLKVEKLLDKIWAQADNLKSACAVYNEKTKENQLPFKSIVVVLKMPKRFYKDEKKNLYKDWYDKYLQKKIFKVDKPEDYYKALCSGCGSEDVKTYLPDCFNNLNPKKSFLKHLNRTQPLNITVCSKCALDISKFQSIFLKSLKMSIFPLFIDSKARSEEILLLKSDDTIKKANFREIVEDISRKVDRYTLDLYLIIYKNDILFLDYVSGFKLKMNGGSIFEIEEILNKRFFESKLSSNYFGNVDTKRKNLDLLIYKYRTLIFDFCYRAKYQNLNRSVIEDIFLDSLGFKFRTLISDKSLYIKLREMKNEFLKLDKIIGGERMKRIEEIRKNIEISDVERFSYYAGQVTYYLLCKSKAGNKTHALLDPFINIGSIGILVDRILEMFNKYKHDIWLSASKFNKTLSGILGFYNDNKELKFDRDLRILFFAGYLDENVFFTRSAEKETEKEEV